MKAFYFGPVQADLRDMLLVPELERQGGVPFYLDDASDGGALCPYRELAPDSPLFLLDPLERRLPASLWRQSVPKQALLYDRRQDPEILKALVSSWRYFELSDFLVEAEAAIFPELKPRAQRPLPLVYLFGRTPALDFSRPRPAEVTLAAPQVYDFELRHLLVQAQDFWIEGEQPNDLHHLARLCGCGLFVDRRFQFPAQWGEPCTKQMAGLELLYFPPVAPQLRAFRFPICKGDWKQHGEKNPDSQRDAQRDNELETAIGQYKASLVREATQSKTPEPIDFSWHFSWLVRLPGRQAAQARCLLDLPLLSSNEVSDGSSDETAAYVIEGPYGRRESLAQINGRWAALLEKNAVLHRLSHRFPYLGPAKMTLPQRRPQLWISHQFPPRLERPHVEKWAVIQPWEYGDFPRAWDWVQSCDALWPPSRFVAQGLLRAGVPLSRIKTIPNGVDTQVYRPNPRQRTAQTTRFLCVADYAWRKGLDLLVRAFQAAFSVHDQVELVLKVQPGSLYSFNAERLEIQALLGRSSSAPIRLISEHANEEELAALFQSADFYVHPYRGEGFGMPILEAMACGLPVMVSAGGPALEFCPTHSTLWIPAEIHEVSLEIEQEQQTYWYLEPCVEALSELLRRAHEMPESERRQRGTEMRRRAEGYDWPIIQTQMKQAVEQVLKAPAQSASSTGAPPVLSWQVAEILTSELAATDWHWANPAQAERRICDGPHAAETDKQVLLWWDTLQIPTDIQTDRLYLAADPAIQEALLQAQIPPEQIGLLQVSPWTTQLSADWSEILSEIPPDARCALAYQNQWGEQAGQSCDDWLWSWFEYFLNSEASGSGSDSNSPPWLLLSGPAAQLEILETRLEQIFDLLQPTEMPRVVLVPDFARRPPRPLFQRAHIYLGLDPQPNLHWARLAVESGLQIYGNGRLLPLSAPYALPIPLGNQELWRWHLKHLNRVWPRRSSLEALVQELPAQLLA